MQQLCLYAYGDAKTLSLTPFSFFPFAFYHEGLNHLPVVEKTVLTPTGKKDEQSKVCQGREHHTLRVGWWGERFFGFVER